MRVRAGGVCRLYAPEDPLAATARESLRARSTRSAVPAALACWFVGLFTSEGNRVTLCHPPPERRVRARSIAPRIAVRTVIT